MASFWSDSKVEPKRQFRWTFSMDQQLPSWIVKSVDKPVATVGSVTHNYFGYTYNYPGNVTWNDINITLVDPVNPDAVNSLATLLRQSGYNPPTAATQPVTTISKGSSATAIGNVYIQQRDAAGRVIEQWKLTNPIATSYDFGGSLSYNTEELIELKLTLKYDWAKLEKSGVGGTAGTYNGIPKSNTYF